MRKQLYEISQKADAAFSECASGAFSDRERLKREAGNLNAAVHALQQLREDAAASMEVQRTVLQDSRETREKERERFLQDVSEERVRLAHERTTAWEEVDRAHAAIVESQRNIVDLESRAAAVLRDTARVRAEKEALEAHIARSQEEHERWLPSRI
jgi:ribonuclease HII